MASNVCGKILSVEDRKKYLMIKIETLEGEEATQISKSVMVFPDCQSFYQSVGVAKTVPTNNANNVNMLTNLILQARSDELYNSFNTNLIEYLQRHLVGKIIECKVQKTDPYPPKIIRVCNLAAPIPL